MKRLMRVLRHTLLHLLILVSIIGGCTLLPILGIYVYGKVGFLIGSCATIFISFFVAAYVDDLNRS